MWRGHRIEILYVGKALHKGCPHVYIRNLHKDSPCVVAITQKCSECGLHCIRAVYLYMYQKVEERRTYTCIYMKKIQYISTTTSTTTTSTTTTANTSNITNPLPKDSLCEVANTQSYSMWDGHHTRILYVGWPLHNDSVCLGSTKTSSPRHRPIFVQHIVIYTAMLLISENIGKIQNS